MSTRRQSNEGVVVAFDFDAGHGRVRMGDGTELFFHCTAIADGTRDIAVGTPVRFTIVPGHNGQWEASDLVGVPHTY